MERINEELNSKFMVHGVVSETGSVMSDDVVSERSQQLSQFSKRTGITNVSGKVLS